MLKLSGLGGRLYRGETSIDFVGKRKIWYSFSALLILASAFTLFTQGLHLGIEFKGGSSFTVTTPNASIDIAKQSLTDAQITTQNIIQKVGGDKVRIQTDALTSLEQSTLEATLAKNFNVSIESIDSQIIGPSWGEEITRKALYGLFGFLLVVMLYLAMTFEAKMAISAIIAVIHDVVIFEVTPATIIGFLTILGYSLYDTVVVFDKVRENTKGIAASGKTTYSKAANLAVNQTIVRSFNTSLVALLPVGSILFVGAGLLGAGTLKDLSLALFIGLITGTYSSICIATPILAGLREREPAMQALAKRVGTRGDKVSTNTPTVVESKSDRGPRNQPKRDRRR